MLRLVWNANARRDVRQILRYIGERNSDAADRIGALFERAAEMLPAHPYMYRPGRVPGTREAVVHPNYILIYRVHTDRVSVIAVIHARQQYP